MATKPSSRQTIKPADADNNIKGSQQKLKAASTTEILKTAKLNYRTSLLDRFQMEIKTPLTWLYLTSDHLQDLIACQITDLPAKIAEIFKLNQWETDLKELIMVSLYVSCIKFTRESDFSPAQISTLFSIFKTSMDRSIIMPLHDVLSYFRAMIISHSGNVGDDWDIFGPREAKLGIDYAMSSLFQHFKLYQHFLTTDQDILEIHSSKTLEIPQFEPLPLIESMTKSQYDKENGILCENEMNALAIDDDGEPHVGDDTSESQIKDLNNADRDNPLDILNPEEIRKITAETINSLFSSVNQDYDSLFDEQKSRFMNQIAKYVNN